MGGIVVWSLDGDDDSLTLSEIVSSFCKASTTNTVTYECSPLKQGQRCWWTPEDGIPENQGRCGKTAPLYNGNVPRCDPFDSAYSCCGEFGYCGSEKEFCECSTCVDYSKNLNLLADCK